MMYPVALSLMFTFLLMFYLFINFWNEDKFNVHFHWLKNLLVILNT